MISARLKRLRDEEIILQIGGRGIAKHYPCPDFLTLTRARKRAMYVMTQSRSMLLFSLHAWRRRRVRGRRARGVDRGNRLLSVGLTLSY